MQEIKSKRTFFDLFNGKIAKLKVKFDIESNEEAIQVDIENRISSKTDKKGLEELRKIYTDDRLSDFLNFYSTYNGFTLANPVNPKNVIKKALLEQLSVSELSRFTKKYQPGGEWAWTIDHNKTKSIYRTEEKWLAFAKVDNEPSCLTIFLTGENTGKVFLLNPQPRFNILKPIAKSYNDFLERIAKDPAAFFRLTRAYITFKKENDQHYGYVPVEYIDNEM